MSFFFSGYLKAGAVLQGKIRKNAHGYAGVDVFNILCKTMFYFKTVESGPMSETPYITDVYAGAVQWDQSTFHAFQASRDPEQVAADEQRLQHIFKAAVSPTFKQALDWAIKNDVKFFIDHTLQRAGAYYTMGTGVVGIAARNTGNAEMAEPLLVHEIRHAWQDKQGFIPTIGRNFAEYFMQIALLEADALAYERVTRSEDELLGNTFARGGHAAFVDAAGTKTGAVFCNMDR